MGAAFGRGQEKWDDDWGKGKGDGKGDGKGWDEDWDPSWDEGWDEGEDKGEGKDKDKDKDKGKGKEKDKDKDKDKGKDKGKGSEKGKGAKGPHANHYYVDGKVYDFSEWKFLHPGGELFFARSFQRDISAAVHAYHSDPDKLKPVLEKYEVKLEGKEPKDILSQYMQAPTFILPPDFDARRQGEDVPVYDWSKGFMPALRKKINTPLMKAKIRKADRLFDIVGASICLFHVFVCFPALYYGIFPAWAWVALNIVLRQSIAGVGHYHIHRGKVGIGHWGDSLFDMQYVGAAVILTDGHVMLHHMYTETPADVKRTVFNFMLQIPRLWRVPLFTLSKFGEFFSGHMMKAGGRWRGMLIKVVRSYMLAEMFWALLLGKFHWWFLQFFLCVWVSMFQIVASHDFEVVRETQSYEGLDWGVFQVQHALDTYLTGIQSVDIFLSAGLSCHRVHHVLPYQKSGFANIVCKPALQETCKEFGVDWAPTRNLLLDRFLPLACYYLTAPAQVPAVPAPVLAGGTGLKGFISEHLKWQPLWFGIHAVYRGFMGQTL